MSSITQTSLSTLLDTVDLNISATSDVLNIKQMDGYAAQYSFTAGSEDRVAIITLGGSNEETGPFSSIDDYTLDGSAGSRLINVEFPRYNYIQISTNVTTSGGGTLVVTVSGKSTT